MIEKIRIVKRASDNHPRGKVMGNCPDCGYEVRALDDHCWKCGSRITYVK